MTCSRHPQPLSHLPATPHSDTAHSCLRAPQTPPRPGTPGPERGSLWATRSLGEAAGPSQLSPGRQGGRRGREEHGADVCAHCGKWGRSRVLQRGEGREPEDTASSGSAWNLPRGERPPGHVPTPVLSHPQTGLHPAPRGGTHTDPCPRSREI